MKEYIKIAGNMNSVPNTPLKTIDNILHVLTPSGQKKYKDIFVTELENLLFCTDKPFFTKLLNKLRGK